MAENKRAALTDQHLRKVRKVYCEGGSGSPLYPRPMMGDELITASEPSMGLDQMYEDPIDPADGPRRA